MSLAAGMDAYCERCGSPSQASDGTGSGDQAASARNVPGLAWTRRLRKGGAPAAAEFQLRLCLTCRGYACAACWNDDAGACQICVPLPTAGTLVGAAEPAEPDLVAGGDENRSLITWPAPDFGAPLPAFDSAPATSADSAALPEPVADLPMASGAAFTAPDDPAAQPPPGNLEGLAQLPDETATASSGATGGWLRRTFGRAAAADELPTDGVSDAPGQPPGPEVQPMSDAQPEEPATAYATSGADGEPAIRGGADTDLDALMAAVAAFPIDLPPAVPAVEPVAEPAVAPVAEPAEVPPSALEDDDTEDVPAEDPAAGDVPLAAEGAVLERVADEQAAVDEPAFDGGEAVAVPSVPAEESGAPYLSFVVAPDRLRPAGVAYGPVVEVRGVAEPPPSTRACVNCELPLSALVRYCRRCGSRQPNMAEIAG